MNMAHRHDKIPTMAQLSGSILNLKHFLYDKWPIPPMRASIDVVWGSKSTMTMNQPKRCPGLVVYDPSVLKEHRSGFSM